MGGRLECRDVGGWEFIGDVYPSGRLPGPFALPGPGPGRKIEGNGAGPWDSWIDGSGLSFLGGECLEPYGDATERFPPEIAAPVGLFKCCNLSCGGSLDGLRASCGGSDAKNVISR